MTCDCGASPHKVWCAERRAIREARKAAGAARPAPRKAAATLREERRAAHAEGWRRIMASGHGRRGNWGGGP